MSRRPRQPRLTAATTALALLLGSAGCASPYHFSPRLDTRLPGDGVAAAPAKTALAGDLHLSLAALMDQRRLLWQAAGETEQMKNATAFGLIGLGAAALYRGVRYTDNKGWLQRAGLIGAATLAGAEWLEPSARQKIYLQGAVSLTCLALATAPYEMSTTEYERIKEQIAGARHGLEQLASELRLAGRYTRNSDTWWVVRGGWNKLRWANKVLDSADAAMGNIEQAGPLLRDMSALLASEVATQVNRVSKDLSELPGAIASLKPNVAKLVGADVFAPPKKEDVDQNPPGAAPEKKPGDKSDTAPAAATEPAAKDPQCGAAAPAPAPASAPPADPKAKQQALKAAAAESNKKKETKAEAEHRRILAANERVDDQANAQQLRHRLFVATQRLDQNLGPVASFVQRVASARDGLDLPKACGPAAVVKLVPDKRDLVLQAGETFQFLLEGDTGKAAASYVGPSLAADVLDIAMPLVQANSAVRFTAGVAPPKVVSTTVRISDSRREQNFDITVKVCPAKGG